MSFNVHCSARLVGAVGSHQSFRFDNVYAESVDAVKELVRKDLYADGYEHVHIENVAILKTK